MVIAIPLASLEQSVSTTDYSPARSPLHHKDSRDDRSGLVNKSRRLGRDLSMVDHFASDPSMAWRVSSWRSTLFECLPLLQIALQYVLAHRAIEGRLAIGLGLHALDAGLLLRCRLS
jgi:hypothetical protein